MIKKFNHIIFLLKQDLGLLLSISFGVFLFVLFIQPFALDKLELNNRLIFNAGLGTIVFLFMLLVRIVFHWPIQNYTQSRSQAVLPYFMGGLILLCLNSVAFAFYLRFVAFTSISFYLMFKVILICLAPPIILNIYDGFNELKKQNHSLLAENRELLYKIEKLEDDYQNKVIEIISEYKIDNLKLHISEIIFIKSADNYVEIVFKENESLKKKLIRNTLKNIELQLRPYSIFTRCHRICIVNINYIKKLNRSYNKYWLSIRGYEEHIPVSYQYILKLKELL